MFNFNNRLVRKCLGTLKPSTCAEDKLPWLWKLHGSWVQLLQQYYLVLSERNDYPHDSSAIMPKRFGKGY
eukprot:2799369-Amphidinium_carterae.1